MTTNTLGSMSDNISKYNCGTCDNKEPIPTPRRASETPLRLGERCKITKQKCKKKFTSIVGCASHSSQQSGRERVLETINWHIATAKQELETGYERDGGKWVGSNRTDYPRGKLDALEKLKKELRQGGE